MSQRATVRAVAYYRKSNEDDGSSIDQQRTWAREACAREGIEIVEEFPDQAKKGWDTARRTAFHEMLAFCQEQERRRAPIDAIVCWHSNRFSRADSQETSWFIWEFRKAGVNLIYTASHGWRDFCKDSDRILFNLEQDTTNHRFIQDLAQATTRGRVDAAREGRPLSVCPYGYRKEYEEVVVRGKKRRRPKRLVPGDPAEVEIIRWLFRTYADTITSLKKLAKDLTRRGVPGPKRAPAWSPETLKAILTNPVYVGIPAFGRRQFGKFFRLVDGQPAPAKTRRVIPNDRSSWIVGENRHEPLIDQLTFDKVQRRLAENRRRTTPNPGQVRVLAGLVVCGNCGRNMVGRDTRHKSGVDGRLVCRRRLLCGGYNTFGSVFCGHNSVDEDALVRLLLGKLQDRFTAPGARARLLEEVARLCREGMEGKGAHAMQLRAQLQNLAGQIEVAAQRLLTEDEKLLPVLRGQLHKMQDKHDRLAAELAALEAQPSAAEEAKGLEARIEKAVALVGRLVELRDRADPAALRDVLNEMVSRVEMHFEHTQSGKHRRSRFQYGLIHLRPDADPDYMLMNCSRKRLLWRRERRRSAREPS
jgi:DNA invertase Pin-like site-specific DNA recombinase